MSSEEPICRRDKCKRKKDLDENQLCPVHRCPTPFCTQSKSNKVAVCDVCIAGRTQPLPKIWARASMEEGVTAFLDTKNQIAQFNHPGPKAEHARLRTSTMPIQKVSKGMPVIFTVEPQPSDLVGRWEHSIAAVVDIKKQNCSHAVYVFRNIEDGALQQADPRANEDIEDALPDGWSKRFDDDGDVFFFDHNTNMATYDDPREVDNPEPSHALFKYTHRRRRTTMSGSVKAKWRISKFDMAGFKKLENNLVDISEIPQCVRKKVHNRYLDILPNPRTRVPLEPFGEDPASTYINANFLDSYNGMPKAYIASMGPLPAAIGNFWRMIWQHNVPMIVMVTGLVEKGKRKCERYWPAEEGTSARYDGITVTYVNTEFNKGYQIHNLTASFYGQTRKIKHFWFYAWPDHGVPKNSDNEIYPDDLIGMLLDARKIRKKMKGPLMVHCSAGIGRTGTVIAIEHAMDSLETENQANCVDIIRNLREFRCAMVQHPVQYEFVHEATKAYAELRKVKFAVDGESADISMPSIAEVDEKTLEEERRREKDQAAKKLQRQKTTKQFRPSLLTSSQISGELRQSNRVSDFDTIFSTLDIDGDGHISKKEARMQGVHAADFDRLDADGDGRLTKEEFRIWWESQTA